MSLIPYRLDYLLTHSPSIEREYEEIVTVADDNYHSIAEAQQAVLAELAQLKESLVTLANLPVRTTHAQLSEQYANQLQQLSAEHKEKKKVRDRRRMEYAQTISQPELNDALRQLQQESQQDGIERRRLKQAREQALQPMATEIAQAEKQIRELKLRYSTLSQTWQKQMQAAYLSEQASFSASNLSSQALLILYQDEHLIVIEKPAGLLSVPGRRYHLQDSVTSRLRYQLPDCSYLQPVHRLDQATSGLMIVALSAQSQTAMSQQFAERQVQKTYEAILMQPTTVLSGIIDLPLWADPDNRPKQLVNFLQGKPSQTHFRVIEPGKNPRVEFCPITGRTHQLRVHAAYPKGLNAPILGDALYGKAGRRLCLHAITLKFIHPFTHKTLHFNSPAPF